MNFFTLHNVPAQNGNSENYLVGVRSKIFSLSKMVQFYGNRSVDICPVMQAVGQAGHSLPMRITQCLRYTKILCT